MIDRLKTTAYRRIFPLLAVFLPMLYWFWHFAQNQWIDSRDSMSLFYVIKRAAWSKILKGELPPLE